MSYDQREDTPPTVVIVEDDTELANLFALWLGESYTVHVAPTREAAYRVLDETVDVVVLDKEMPDDSGMEVLAALHHKGLDCQVAMVTAEEPDTNPVTMEFDDYVRKPVIKEELCDIVERLVAQASYRTGVDELYSLAIEKSLFETASSAEPTLNEQHAQLQAHFEDLDEQLAELTETFSRTQFSAELAQLPPEGTKAGGDSTY